MIDRALLVASLLLWGFVAGVDSKARLPSRGALSPSTSGHRDPATLLLPANVTDLRVAAVTDTSAVLTWTEIASNNAAIARYLVRYSLASQPLPVTPPFLTTGGCGSPVYGSTSGGGRTRSCVLGGLAPKTRYAFQVIAYTGNLATTGNFSPAWSNRAEATTAERVGPMLVSRPPITRDSLTIAAASITDYGAIRFPLFGTFRFGDRRVVFYDSTGAVIAIGQLVVTAP